MDASGDIDHNLIPGWVGHCTCPDQCLLKRTGLARQLKGSTQPGTLGQMTFLNVAVLRIGAHNLLSRQVASTADHPNKDGPYC